MTQHLIIDADDTLWENNIYFERAFDEFVEFLAHSSLSGPEIRAVLDEIETVNRTIHGYGAANFGRNLQQCFETLSEREIRPDDLDQVMCFAARILDEPVELIEGVEDTLKYLSGRHELILFTKGHPDEQTLKIDNSGLRLYFQHAAIVHEKDCDSYQRLLNDLGLEPGRTWMIGNSPRSDINPALEIGIGAVYIPHARTWTLEHEEIRNGHGRFFELSRFPELKDHF